MAISYDDVIDLCRANISLFKRSTITQLSAALLFFSLLTFDFYVDKTSSKSPLKTLHSEEKEHTEEYVGDPEKKGSHQIGEWIRVSNAITPYGSKMCNFSFHTWNKYAAKSMKKRSLSVQLWVWQKFLDEYTSNTNIFEAYASRFLNSFGKNRTMLLIG